MILGAEIGLLVMGIIAMVKGKLTLTKNRIVYGLPGRLIAIFALLPLPLALMIGVGIGVYHAIDNPQFDPNELQRRYGGVFIAIELGCIVLSLALLYGIGLMYAELPRPNRPMIEDDDDSVDDDLVANEPPEVERAPTMQCTECGGKLKLTSAIAGKKVRCPKCEAILTAPLLPESSEAIVRNPRRRPTDEM